MSRSRVPPFLTLLPIVLFSALPPAQCQEERSGRAAPAVTLGIEIDLPAGGPWPVAVGEDHAVFYISAMGTGEMLGIIAVPEGRFAGVRITPSMGENSVKIKVSALVTTHKKLSEATYSEILSWPSEDAGSYEGKKDESLLLSGLAQLGLPVFKVKVVGVRIPVTTGGPPPPPPGAPPPPPPGGPRGSYADRFAFCECDALRDAITEEGRGASSLGPGGINVLAYPDAGECAEIGKFAGCCRILKP
jgi:hypothetical protein